VKTTQLVFSLLFISLLTVSAHVLGGEKILIPQPPKLAATSYLLEDANSGKVLAEKNPDERLAPASLTKIMTVYVVFRELAAGNLQLADQVIVSKNAWKTPGSRMFIEVNRQVGLEDLLKGIIIASGNDASVAVAEYVAGDEATFAQMMNQQAERLGMKDTHYSNATGLPAEEHYTTARDLAILTRALIKEFPEYYKWHAIQEFTYNKIKQHNRNKLLWRNKTVDGVKTGHTEEAGYCLVASAKRDDMRLISVVMGTRSESARAGETQALLNYGFRFFETHRLYGANEALTEARIWKGDTTELSLGLQEDLYVTIPRRQFKNLNATLDIDSPIIAPVEQAQPLGKLTITLSDEEIVQKPLTALQSVAEGNIFRRLFDQALLLLE
jgi:serine-type D-Ala-D-Ala carboxypeptidase (penicillin-binding protein 5/6)